jgi:hypothetical protein
MKTKLALRSLASVCSSAKAPISVPTTASGTAAGPPDAATVGLAAVEQTIATAEES